MCTIRFRGQACGVPGYGLYPPALSSPSLLFFYTTPYSLLCQGREGQGGWAFNHEPRTARAPG